MFSPVSLGAGKKYTNQVALGFSNVSIDNTTGTVTITLTDGSNASWTFPIPANGKDGKDGKDGSDGISVVGIVPVDDTHFMWEFSDGSKSASVEYPKQLIELSKDSGNTIVKKADGLYVATSSVSISQQTDNAVTNKADGLYVKDLSNDVSGKINKTDVVDNLTSTDTDKPLSANQGKLLNDTKFNATTSSIYAGKVVIVDANGVLDFGDAGVKVSAESENQIETKSDGIYVNNKEVFVTSAEYENLPASKLTDDKKYFID